MEWNKLSIRFFKIINAPRINFKQPSMSCTLTALHIHTYACSSIPFERFEMLHLMCGIEKEKSVTWAGACGARNDGQLQSLKHLEVRRFQTKLEMLQIIWCSLLAQQHWHYNRWVNICYAACGKAGVLFTLLSFFFFFSFSMSKIRIRLFT